MAGRRTGAEDALNRLLRRCVECPPNVIPTCPQCASDQICQFVPQSCGACPYMECIDSKGIPGVAPQKPSTSIGGIVGGVAGGVIGIILVTFLIWKFCIRKKKRQDLWVPPEKSTVSRSGTMLSRTHSIASTVMTRASNVIQIAYIPGVTVRSAPESPEIAPPIPTVPSAYAATSAHPSPDLEQHFFMPKDLRDSVWSDTTSIRTDNRVSIAPSLAIRETIYQASAVVPQIPAQYAYRAQANAVSVRPGNTTPNLSSDGTSAVSSISAVPKAINIKGSSFVGRSVVARPIEVKRAGSSNSGTQLDTLPRKSPSRRATPVPVVSDEKEVVISRGMAPTPASMAYSDSPLLQDSLRSQQPSALSMASSSIVLPAEGPLGSVAPSGRPTTAYTQAMIHEAMLRATQDMSHSSSMSTPVPKLPEPKRHDCGPFSDANEIK